MTNPRVRVIAVVLFLANGARAADDPSPRVERQTIVFESRPRIRVRVADGLRYVGEHPIRIRDVAAGKRIVFAETAGKEIRRMAIAQFEGFLPGVDDIYRYKFDGMPTMGGLPFRENGFASSTRAEMKENPGSEVEATMRFLSEKGLRAPDEWAIYRFVTIGDATRKNEMILFSMEPLAGLGTTYPEVSERLPAGMLDGLAARARRVFRIEPLP